MRATIRSSQAAALLALLLIASTGVRADPQVLADACATADPGIQGLFDATVYLVNTNYQQVVLNADQTTYSLTPIGSFTSSPDGPLDPTSAYYGDPQAPAGHSGVLISNKSVLTSAHSLPFGYTAYIYILGLYAKNISANCQYPDLQHIPKDDVYFASKASNGLYNGVVLNTWSPAAEENDFVVITLDRPVVGHVPLPVRKSGFAAPTDRFAAVHFGERLIPVKGDFAIAHMNETSPSGVAIANTSLTPGSSGGAIFNLDAGLIETVASIGNSCLYFNRQPSGDYILAENCPGAFYPVNGPVTAISASPLFTDVDLIFHYGFD